MIEHSPHVDVAVIGGGIAGLVAAYRLFRQAPHLRVVILEREQRWGGKLLTDYRSGFVMEGGADSFLASKPEATDLCRELGLEQHLIGTNQRVRRTFVVRDGSLEPIPDGLSGLVPAQLGPILGSNLFSEDGKARLLRELEIAPRTDAVEETLAGFIVRRFGQEVYDRLIEPLMSGIYAGDGTKLSVDATFPQIRRMERDYGSVVRGIQHLMATGPAAPKPGFLTPRRGLSEMIEALKSVMPRSYLHSGMEATALSRTQRGYTVTVNHNSSFGARSVILAVPAYTAATLVAGMDTDLAHLLGSIPYISTATVLAAFPREALDCPLEGFGYLVPRIEGGQILACTWTSSKFAGRAPEGHVLLRAFVGRAGQEELVESADADIENTVRAELQLRLNIRAEPEFMQIYRWPKAMPQYVLGHADRIGMIRNHLEEFRGLLVAGHAFSGVGIPDCIRSGSEAATLALV